MGVVYRGYDQRLERDVALKVLPPSALDAGIRRKRLRKEALTLSRLNHPNIAHVYDVDTQEGVDFLVMEFVRGVTLAELLKDGPIAESRVIGMGRQIASTLADAHQEGIIHCDIKPGNIMLDAKEQIKILDFGLAQILRTDDLAATESMGSAFCGTLPYMSPEQLRGNVRDPRSDVYSLGVTLYELATGRRPFINPNPLELADDIRRQPAPAPQKIRPEVSSNLQNVILRCLEKDPSLRYQSAGELAEGLTALVSGTTPVLPRVRRFSRGQQIAAAAVILILIAAAIFLIRFKTPPAQNAERELVILPISNQVAADAAFGDGLLDTLGTRLARLGNDHALQIVPASEMAHQKLSTLQEAREQFGVNLGLAVAVQHDGDMVRVNYALIEAKGHRQIYGDTITAPADKPFDLEDKVADSVVRALGLQLRPEERRQLTEQSTKEPAAYDDYLQGRGYLQEFYKPENVEAAIREFRQATEKDPGYALAYAGLGEAYWRKQQLSGSAEWVDQARTACDRAVELRPDEAAGHYCLGLIFRGTGHYEEAAEQYKQATERDPGDDRYVMGLGSAYEKLGKFDLAEATLRHAIVLRDRDWQPYEALGELYLSRANYSDAIKMFSQVISLIPDSFVGYSNLGSTYIQQGDYNKAIPILQQSVAIRATAGNTSNLAYAYFQLRRFTEAARSFEHAVALDDTKYDVWGNLGDAYYWAPGERANAARAYARAIVLGEQQEKINPRDAALLAYLAQDYAMSDKKAEARDYITRALRLDSVNPDLLATAALVFNQLGETNKALDYLERAVKAGYSQANLLATPNFDNLHDLSRFEVLLKNMSIR